jgi:ParB/RepB/Spo0J family partition protein
VLEEPAADEDERPTVLGVAPDAVARLHAKMQLVHIPLEQIAESPLNTRKRFNEATLAELAESLRSEGQLTPALVRPHASGHGIYELAAGHRRYRAAKLAGLATLAAMVRPMDDETFLKVLTIENLQREDVHPLEEADGYAELIEVLRYDVAKIASSVGKSERYIYDRLKLRTLAPEVRELFFAGRIELAHAIELTRIPQAAQRLAIDPHKGGLWAVDHGSDFSLFTEDDEDFDDEFDDDADEGKPRAPTPAQLEHRKPSSVRELKKWIHEHVRLDPAAEHLTMDLPETVQELQAAAVDAVKVVEITELNHVHPDARGEGRVLGPRSWKCADPKRNVKDCEHAVLGVVVLGPGQGAAFKVCTAKQKCRTHWAEEIREAAKRAKAVVTGNAPAAAAPKESSWDRGQRLKKEYNAKVAPALPALLRAFAAAVKKASPKPKGPLEAVLIARAGYIELEMPSKAAEALVPRGKSGDDFMRWLAMGHLAREVELSEHGYVPNLRVELPKFGKLFGVDVEKIVKAEVAAPTVKPSTASSSTKKKAAKKKAAR